MKKLLIAIMLALITLGIATPVLAQDPMQVDVGVVTGGDVNVGVNVNAGGSVNVDVNGVDLQDTASTAQSAYDKAFAPTDHLNDFSIYWRVSGIGAQVEGQIAQLQGIVQLLIGSQAKLIQENGGNKDTLTGLLADTQSLGTQLEQIASEVQSLQSEDTDLKAQDDKTWNQLMNGAEAHLAILQSKTEDMAQQIADQNATISDLQSQLDAANSNYAVLYDYTVANQQQTDLYFLIGGGAGVVILGVALWALLRQRSF